MKVGILTYHCVPNFGAQLQTMSTVGYLKKKGHTPVVLHWYPKDLEELYAHRVPKIQRKCHKRFTENNYPLSSLCRNEKQLIKEIERQQLDMIITGSDALFKYVPMSDRRREFSLRKFRYVNNFLSCEDLSGNPFFCDYYGELSKQIPVVAFSVSSQNCPFYKLSLEERELMGSHLRCFKTITVRDNWTKQMVESVSGLIDIEITPDPVFAFNQNCYIHIPTKEELSSRFSLPQHYVLLSFPMNFRAQEYVKKIADLYKSNGITPVILSEPEGMCGFVNQHCINLPLNPIEWFALIKNADAYIGTRMHPIITCLHNGVPFFSFDGNGTRDPVTKQFNPQSSKIYDILERAHLEGNTYALRSKKPLPKIDDLFHQVACFDKKQCLTFSYDRLNSYLYHMDSILKM